ncbi:MAG TPA: type II secretion system protein [Pyrinomonadaceae bacterium]
MKTETPDRHGERGFSLLELVISMGLTVVVMSLAAQLIASGVHIKAREERRIDAVADVRRALNAMSREISNAGYGLPAGLPANGIVEADSDTTQLRLLSNSDAFSTEAGATPDSVTSPDEDVILRLVDDGATGQSYIMRFDVNSAVAGYSVLANRIDSMSIRYFDRRVTYSPGRCEDGIDAASVRDAAGNALAEVPPSRAKYLVIAVCVTLPAVGTPGAPGHQPPSSTQLISDVQLRNAQGASY